MSDVFISAILTGVFSTIGTVIAMRTDIKYIREGLADAKKAITRAHERIDNLQKH